MLVDGGQFRTMKVSTIIFLFIWSFSCTFGKPHTDVTYEELEELDASCLHLDTCKFERAVDTLMRYTCHCGAFCSRLDTCCIDSPYRSKKTARPVPSCRSTYGPFNSHYFMVDECPSSSSKWKELCEGSAGEDLMSLVPVTSLSTNVTFKNYFCFRCHETSDRYRYWNIKILADLKSDEKGQKNVALLRYSKVNQTWMAPVGEGDAFVPVTLSTEMSNDIHDLPKQCVPNVISDCSEEWPDEDVRRKCGVYASIVHFTKTAGTVSYKNPHCALCNFENLEKMLCSLSADRRTSSKQPFSFNHLLDVNRSDGEIVGEVRRCGDDSVWDPYFKKCRILTCALPGYAVQNGECKPS